MRYALVKAGRNKLHGDTILDMVPSITFRSAIQANNFIGPLSVFFAVSGQVRNFRFEFGMWFEIREVLKNKATRADYKPQGSVKNKGRTNVWHTFTPSPYLDTEPKARRHLVRPRSS